MAFDWSAANSDRRSSTPRQEDYGNPLRSYVREHRCNDIYNMREYATFALYDHPAHHRAVVFPSCYFHP